jgi:hypothetical protein
MKSKEVEMKTLHDSFYWELLWCMMANKDLGYTYEKTIKKYWKHVNLAFPKKGLSLVKATKIIRIALLKYGCQISGIPYTKELINEIPFYQDNHATWSKVKLNLIKIKEGEMPKIKLKKSKLTLKKKGIKKFADPPPEKKTRREVEIFVKPQRETLAYLGKCKAVDFLLKRKYTDNEIITFVKEDPGYIVKDMEWVRRSLNRGCFVEYDSCYEKPEKPVKQITSTKKKPVLKKKKKLIKKHK